LSRGAFIRILRCVNRQVHALSVVCEYSPLVERLHELTREALWQWYCKEMIENDPGCRQFYHKDAVLRGMPLIECATTAFYRNDMNSTHEASKTRQLGVGEGRATVMGY